MSRRRIGHTPFNRFVASFVDGWQHTETDGAATFKFNKNNSTRRAADAVDSDDDADNATAVTTTGLIIGLHYLHKYFEFELFIRAENERRDGP